MKGKVVELSSKEAWEFIGPKHYAGRKPPISRAFGWEIQDKIVAAITFGKPASPPLCKGICGDKWSKNVYELNRLCRIEELNEQLSSFVCACLRRLRALNWIIVSFPDTGMNHNGYIYQACNFIYTGITKERTDKYTEDGKHARHYDNSKQGEYRQIRTAKHRYVYFATYSKKLKQEWMNELNYPVMDYPKGINKNYILGEFQKPILIKIEK